tara:strand:+ start:64 stop:519 length:456 start_codon:yes stop_codon:yes gene_type:complete
VKKYLLLVLLVIIDIISKKFVYNLIDLNTFISITFFMELTHIHNFGISFGLFSGLISSWILVIIGLLVTIFIYYLMQNSSDIVEEWGLFLIITGAIANILDRSINGYVIDFIFFHYNSFSWPAFNIADIYITIGIMMIILSIIKNFKKRKL